MVELFDIHHKEYEHARIGTIMWNLATSCPYGTIYPDYVVILTNKHIKHAWKLLIRVEVIIMVDEVIWCDALEENQYVIENPQIYWENEKT